MRKMVFSKSAAQDLQDLWEYIAQENPMAADLVVGEVEAALERLRTRPLAGHERTDLTAAPVRFWTVRHYLVIYRFDDETLQVVRVLSGYRDIAALLP